MKHEETFGVIMVVVIRKRKVMPQIEGGWGRWHQRAGEGAAVGHSSEQRGRVRGQGLVGQSHRVTELVGLIVKRRQQQIKARRGSIGSSHRSGLGAKKSGRRRVTESIIGVWGRGVDLASGD
jgi:hypothetical protein